MTGRTSGWLFCTDARWRLRRRNRATIRKLRKDPWLRAEHDRRRR